MTNSAAVFCPCREPAPLEPNKLPTLFGRAECYFGLNTLLFCPQCVSVRCPFCTDSGPVAYFCAACLMETTQQEARAASNRCMRNCLRCPRCAANAVLKPAAEGGAKMLGVECANAACAWKYAGLFRVPAKDAQPLSVAQQCRLLLEHSFRGVLHSVEQELSARPGAPASVVHAVPPHLHAQVSAADARQELPQLVPLRAKWAKKCRVCETLLVDPVRQPSQPSFKSVSLARRVLPACEAYRVGAALKLVVRNFGAAALDVQIASTDAETAVLTPRVVVPPLSAEGFFAPLFLVERETTASRQAFMAHASQERGRGWAVCELEAPAEQKELRLFTSSAFRGSEATAKEGAQVGTAQEGAAEEDSVKSNSSVPRRIGAWMKVPIVLLDTSARSSG